jgi:hypothetical protein
VVTYNEQVNMVGRGTPLFDQGLIDGISLWIEGPEQGSLHGTLTALVGKVRSRVGPTMPIFTGAYLLHSHTGWLPPAPFYDMLEQSVALYDDNRAQGFYIFAGNQLSRMNRTQWESWRLPAKLHHSTHAWLGDAHVHVRDAASGEPISGALVHAAYNGSTHVTSKRTSVVGVMSFGGWAGKASPASHTLSVTADGYKSARATVQLAGSGRTTRVEVPLKKL